ncbi:hypothetical protein J5491_02890 [Candidatus Saccharibacteria bacterium]|nr:hypothetical protein [Candidatus Saccharibacteria bacterium]
MKELHILFTIITSLFGFAGGGGSDSDFDSGGSFDFSGDSYGHGGGGGIENIDWSHLFLIFVVSIVFSVTILYIEDISRRHRNRKELLELRKKYSAMDQNSTEQERWIHAEAERIFKQYQQDWSDYNLDSIRGYTTDRYFQHACLMLEAVDQMNRRNVVSDLSVAKTTLNTQVNSETKLPAVVQLIFCFNGTDGLVAVDTKKKIFSNYARGMMEYWNYVYDGGSLKLDGITQSTESTPHLVESIAEFAKENNLFYSADWGRLALPTKGLIFENYDVLADADVNNHVIGKWNNCLVQIYTYSPWPSDPNLYYIVGQIIVPKTYEGVIVEAKKAKLRVTRPKDYGKYDMEWGEFTRRYKVYAASKDALPAFELLDPTFMEKLYERNLPYNLEVKGNCIYIFAKVRNAKKEDYAELLNVLSEAFGKLKM